MTKICYHCKIAKELGQYTKNKTTPDGLCYYCIECTKEKKRIHYNKNKININKKCKEWRLNNREKDNAARLRCYYGNKEAHKIRQNRYLSNPINKLRKQEYNNKWREENKQWIKIRDRNYRLNNPEKERLRSIKRREKCSILDIKFTESDALLVREKFDNCCFRCRSSTI